MYDALPKRAINLMNTKPKIRVAVGMSGGVDSSVTALLLKEQGVEVQGIFMKNWEKDDTDLYCHSAQDVYDAKQVADKIGIPLSSVNFATHYWDRVFTHFLNEFKAGRTPNPDILCNKEIKFKAFLDHALALGADKIATGHYAQIVEKDGEFQLHKALDRSKDQSYFLHALKQDQLKHVLFPLGQIPKTQVREIAAAHGFINATKKDSTGICFIGERKFKEFLQDYLPAQPGEIVTLDGKVLGRHEGLMYYTLGQRQGLGIGGVAEADESPWFVAQKNLANNTLVVVQGTDHPALFSPSLQVDSIDWIGRIPALPLRCMAKTRYRQPDQACLLEQTDQGYTVTFETPQRAVTPGQSVVFYLGDQCLGGGIIN
jgi:tRNA-specific 2-thiouridylase